jgi:hypothetical protein
MIWDVRKRGPMRWLLIHDFSTNDAEVVMEFVTSHMKRMEKKRPRKIPHYSAVADKPIGVGDAFPSKVGPASVECLIGQSYARNLNREIVSYCEKHFRYGG